MPRGSAPRAYCIDSEEIATFTLPPALAMIRSVLSS